MSASTGSATRASTTKRIALLVGLVPLLLACGLTSGNFSQRPPHPTSTRSATETIVLAEKTPTPTAQPTCRVTATSLHVRDAGDADAHVIGYLSAGDTVVILSGNDWLRVQTVEGVTGWINGKYCE